MYCRATARGDGRTDGAWDDGHRKEEHIGERREHGALDLCRIVRAEKAGVLSVVRSVSSDAVFR